VSAVKSIPSSLDSDALARRLGELVGDERNVQVEFLLHLDEFDRRRAYLDAGFGSLWDYCLRALHLREGAAGRRIGAMRVLRRFPRLERGLRDGRLCLSTASLLGQVLTEGNLEDLVARAAFKTKADVEHLVASVRPREAPREGIRKLAAPAAGASSVNGSATVEGSGADSSEGGLLALPVGAAVATRETELAARSAAAVRVEPARPRPAEVRPVSEDQWSVRVTLDAAAKEELETLKALLSHKIPDGDLGAVLREAIRCAVEKYGRRKGATAPAQKRRRRESDSTSPHIPMDVRREVMKRDGGCCTWTSDDGRRCGSRWQLELDHIRPVALGGTPTVDNLRLRCRPHNMRYAEQVYGREHMEQFRRRGSTVAGDGSSTAPVGGAEAPSLV
jgi:5-methylcytosine-specific restriction endonuclease McrA